MNQIVIPDTDVELLQDLSALHWHYDFQARSFAWPESLFQLFHLAPVKDPSFDTVRRFVCEESLDKWDRFFKELFEGRDAGPVEVMLSFREQRRLFFLSASVIRKEDKPLYLSGIIQDLTQRRKLEEELIRNEEKLSKFSQLATEGCIILDQGIIVDVNPAFEKMSDCPREEMLGLSAATLVTKDSARIMAENLRNNYTFPYELVMVRRDGKQIPIEVQGYYFEYGGKTLRFTSIRDISKLKEKEKLGANLSVLIDLSKSKSVINGAFLEATGEILRKTAETLQVSRASLWQFTRSPLMVRRLCLFDRDKQVLDTKRIMLPAVAYQNGLGRLQREGSLVVSEVAEDSDTSKVPVSAFWAEGIQSVLQIPVIIDGEIRGIFSLENLRESKNWGAQDMLFVKSAVDIITVTYESFQRQRAERKVKQKNIILNRQKQIIEEKNKDILDSIYYSRRIQTSFLKNPERLKESFPESFILYKPKDIIGGDFYWYQVTNGRLVLAIADCTGHGVPGALMSVLGVTNINKLVSQFPEAGPGFLLGELDKAVKAALHDNEESGQGIRDGMEVGLMVYDPGRNHLLYAGAMRPLLVQRRDGLEVVKADKISIGDIENTEVVFTEHVVTIHSGDRFYLFSDGLQDQFGGGKGKKFTMKRLQEIILNSRQVGVPQQGKLIESEFQSWKGTLEQTDDVLIAGLSF